MWPSLVLILPGFTLRLPIYNPAMRGDSHLQVPRNGFAKPGTVWRLAWCCGHPPGPLLLWHPPSPLANLSQILCMLSASIQLYCVAPAAGNGHAPNTCRTLRLGPQVVENTVPSYSCRHIFLLCFHFKVLLGGMSYQYQF